MKKISLNTTSIGEGEPVYFIAEIAGNFSSNDEAGEYVIGNAYEEKLYDIWHGEKIQKVRDLHKKHTGYKTIEPCKKCYLPRKTKPEIEVIGDKKILVDKYTHRTEEIGK